MGLEKTLDCSQIQPDGFPISSAFLRPVKTPIELTLTSIDFVAATARFLSARTCVAGLLRCILPEETVPAVSAN